GIGCHQRTEQHPATAGQQRQSDDHHAERDDVPAPLSSPLSPALVVPATLLDSGLGGPRLRLGWLVEEVRHAWFSSSLCCSSVWGARSGRGSGTSPGPLPLLRSWSSADCRIITAATRSTTERCLRPARPDACSAGWAVTVPNRSSTNRTGTGWTAVLSLSQ